MKDTIKDIKDSIKTEKVILGTEQTLKLIKQGKIKKIFVSLNCPPNIVLDLERYSKIDKFELIKTQASNKEMGVFAKKPFSVSIISILK